MHEYEILVETMNPCGGSEHAKRGFFEAEAASPEAYVRENSPYPILDISRNTVGDLVITSGDGKGNLIRYTFTE